MENYKNSNYYIYYEIADEENSRRIITNQGDLDTIDKYSNSYDYCTPIQLKFVDKAPNDDILKEYLKNFEIWKDECMNNGIYKVDITQGDVRAMQQFFFSLVNGYKDKITKKLLHDKICSVEYKIFEKCANNAVMYLKQDNIEVQCWSYDRKLAYANLLGSSLQIPTRRGKLETLKELPKVIKVGFYHIKITYADTDFLKCFVISKSNWYVDISLQFALELKDQFGLTFELIEDEQPNAYLYDEDDITPISAMSKNWLIKVKALKAKYPKNPYIKQLASGTWGVINQRNTLHHTADEINKKGLDFGLTDDHQYMQIGRFEKYGEDYYKMVNTQMAYKYQIRLKPWITAQARNDIGRLALKHINNVIRIQTDSISFDKDIELKDENYAVEAKTTGLIHWRNVNAYYNKTTEYKSKTY